MSDSRHVCSEPAGDGPAPEAIPLPDASARRRRILRRTLLTGVVVFALAALAACAIAGVWLNRYAGDIATGLRTNIAGTSPLAVMGADRSWVFVTTSDAFGNAAITAVRVSDGATRTITDYWLVAVEPTGSRVRVVRDPGTSALDLIATGRSPQSALDATYASVVSPDWQNDLPGTVTMLWDPSLMDAPQQSDWAGDDRFASDGRVASFVIDPSHGAYPSAIDLSSSGVDFTVESTRTLQPLGWSASGRYYATVDLIAETTPSAEAPEGRVTLRIWDVARRSEVASATYLPSLSRRAIWSPVEDAVYWTQMGEDDGPFTDVAVLRPGRRASTVTLPSRYREAGPMVAGADRAGVIVRCGVREGSISSESSGTPASPPAGSRESRAHVRITAGGRASVVGSDTVPALYCDVDPTGVMWWFPVFDESADASPYAAGIRVWWAPSLEASPTLLFHANVPTTKRK